TAQVDVEQPLPLLRARVEKILEAVPPGVVHQDVHRFASDRGSGFCVTRNIENQRLAVHLPGNAFRGLTVLVADQDRGAGLGEAPADGGADGAAAPGDEHRLCGQAFHFGRLSMTRFALPTERSIAPMRTSVLMPMRDLMACSRPAAAPASPSTTTVR